MSLCSVFENGWTKYGNFVSKEGCLVSKVINDYDDDRDRWFSGEKWSMVKLVMSKLLSNGYYSQILGSGVLCIF